jgi:GDP-L-fucose synthase
MEQDARICVAGRTTLIGAAILRELKREGCANIAGEFDEEPDWSDPERVSAFFDRTAPAYVFVAAGKSGGIQANQAFPAELMRDNVLIACSVIESAYRHKVKKLLYLASSCTYPRHCPQPMRVESLLTGALEPTNEAYAVAKIAGITLCQAYRQQYGANFITGIPGDPFGPGDDFHPENAHVVAALIRRMHEAKVRGAPSVQIWGTGNPRREFIFADDLADACLFVMRRYEEAEPINLTGGWDVSIREVAGLIQDVVGYEGQLRFDPSRPDGMPVKVLDASRLAKMGWHPQADLRSALSATYHWFLEQREITRNSIVDA